MIHHAGAGTAAAGLRAGVPAVSVPMISDQPFWAARLAALGTGPRPIPYKRLSAQARPQRSGPRSPVRPTAFKRRRWPADWPARRRGTNRQYARLPFKLTISPRVLLLAVITAGVY